MRLQLNMYIYIWLFIKYLPHVSTHTAPSSGRTLVTCSKLSAYCNVITSVTERTIYHMWVLQRYVLLWEQYLALFYVLKSYWKCTEPLSTICWHVLVQNGCSHFITSCVGNICSFTVLSILGSVIWWTKEKTPYPVVPFLCLGLCRDVLSNIRPGPALPFVVYSLCDVFLFC